MSALFDHVAMLARIPLDIQKVMELPAPLSPSPESTDGQAPRQSGDFPLVGSIYGDEE